MVGPGRPRGSRRSLRTRFRGSPGDLDAPNAPNPNSGRRLSHRLGASQVSPPNQRQVASLDASPSSCSPKQVADHSRPPCRRSTSQARRREIGACCSCGELRGRNRRGRRKLGRGLTRRTALDQRRQIRVADAAVTTRAALANSAMQTSGDPSPAQHRVRCGMSEDNALSKRFAAGRAPVKPGSAEGPPASRVVVGEI